MRKITFGLTWILLILMTIIDAWASEVACNAPARRRVSDDVLPQRFYELFFETTGAKKRLLHRNDQRANQVSYHQVAVMANPVFIDLRSSAEFHRARIPGSINVAPRRLLTGTTWKDHSLILVDELYRLPELTDLTTVLERSSFKGVHILDRGLSGWRAAGGALEGIAVFDARPVSPEQLWASKTMLDWLIVDVNSGEPFPSSTDVVRVHSSSANLQKVIQAAKEHLTADSLAAILIVDERGSQYKNIFDSLPQDIRPYVYYLKGGLESYYSFADLNKRASEAVSRTTRDKMSCLGGQ